jgi:hypothetical protein
MKTGKPTCQRGITSTATGADENEVGRRIQEYIQAMPTARALVGPAALVCLGFVGLSGRSSRLLTAFF